MANNLATGGNYSKSLSAGTIKRFSDNIVQELGEYKSNLSHIFAKKTRLQCRGMSTL